MSEHAFAGLKEPAACRQAGSAAPGVAAGAGGGATLDSCLAAFFAPEAITWECPKEAAEVGCLSANS